MYEKPLTATNSRALRRRIARSAGSLSLCVAWSSIALGAGFEYPDNGAQAMGRGSAFAAKANDGTAIYYNPSGLAQQDGWRVLVAGQAVLQAIDYQRTDAAGNNIGPQVSNSGGPFFAPFIAVSKQIIPGLTVWRSEATVRPRTASSGFRMNTRFRCLRRSNGSFLRPAASAWPSLRAQERTPPAPTRHLRSISSSTRICWCSIPASRSAGRRPSSGGSSRSAAPCSSSTPPRPSTDRRRSGRRLGRTSKPVLKQPLAA